MSRRGGGREPCHSPKYFGQPHSSLPHRLRAEPFGPGPLCRWRDISPHRGESPSQRGPRGEHTFFDSLHLTLFLFPLPCSRLIRSTRMHRFLESSACRSSELHQPTVQLEYRMQSSGRLSATSNGKRYHYFLLRFYRTKRDNQSHQCKRNIPIDSPGKRGGCTEPGILGHHTQNNP